MCPENTMYKTEVRMKILRRFTAYVLLATAFCCGLSQEVAAQAFNIKTFGAKCDDATDDSAAIQAALNASLAVYVPAGTCRFGTTLKWQNVTATPAVIYGDGWGRSILKYTGTGTAMSSATPANRSSVNISRLRLTKFGAAGSSIGINLSATEFGRVFDVMVDGFDIGQQLGLGTTSDGYFNATDSSYFNNNTTHVSVNGTIGPIMWSNKNYWSRNKFNGGTTGYTQQYGDSNSITDNTFENMTNAVVISKGRGNSVLNNYIDSTVSGTGITVGTNVAGDTAYNTLWNPLNQAATPISDGGGASMVDGRSQSRGLQVVNTAKAWCTVNGTLAGTNAPRNGFGVTSVTRNSTGVYTINLTDPLPGANPAIIATGDDTTAGAWMRLIAGTLGASSFQVEYLNAAGTHSDPLYFSVLLFGGT